MTLRPARGLLTVKPVRTQETFAGGRIILTENERTSWAQWQMEVVAVGEPEWCQAPKKKCLRYEAVHARMRGGWDDTSLLGTGPEVHCRDTRLVPGAWVIIRPRAIVDTGSEEKMYVVKQEDVLGVFALAEPAGQ